MLCYSLWHLSPSLSRPSLRVVPWLSPRRDNRQGADQGLRAKDEEKQPAQSPEPSTYTHTCMFTYMHVHAHTCVHTQMHVHIRTDTCMCIYMPMHTYICPHACIYTCMFTYMHTNTCVYVSVCMYKCTAFKYHYPASTAKTQRAHRPVTGV